MGKEEFDDSSRALEKQVCAGPRIYSEQEMKYILKFAPGVKEFFGNFGYNKIRFESLFGKEVWASLLETCFATFSQGPFTLPAGSILYRARVFEDLSTEDALEARMWKTIPFRAPFYGYDAENSGAPLPEQCKSDNRCNRSGVSYLYAASSPLCAIYEVFNGSLGYVSVAEMEMQREARLANLSMESLFAYDASDPANKWLARFFESLRDCFADSETACLVSDPYLICQTFSDAAKSLGCDGLVFRSSKAALLGNEKMERNYVFFDREIARPISSELCRIGCMKLAISREYRLIVT